MNLLYLVIISIIPGLLWVYFFYRKDKYEPEPVRLVLRSFLYGALLVIPVGLIEAPFAGLIANPPSLTVLLGLSIFVIGLTEEVGKFAVVWYTIYDSDEFNEVMDGIIYSISVALGFAAVENLLYAFVFGFRVGVVRAVVTSLVHASFSGIMGFYLGKAKCEKRSNLITIGLVQVVLLHGIYDFLILGGLVPNYVMFGIIILLYLYLTHLIRKALQVSPFK
ncbi:PrsW family glutamic-type intramembrane protease [Natroniella sulfidigena]|uniref:PrsW family intramembrane metalloprotease n=1 Tax=Natroniella sulfidigena TaxID=723921 RepID=UPI00200ABD29|nr:PrsW family glutamic-type intramembrane protease [Natroniella sulfidigena]MCK8816074.1 PrsW family glutamic-type intramembrane protease [Natroniella sulfidigena]